MPSLMCSHISGGATIASIIGAVLVSLSLESLCASYKIGMCGAASPSHSPLSPATGGEWLGGCRPWVSLYKRQSMVVCIALLRSMRGEEVRDDPKPSCFLQTTVPLRGKCCWPRIFVSKEE